MDRLIAQSPEGPGHGSAPYAPRQTADGFGAPASGHQHGSGGQQIGVAWAGSPWDLVGLSFVNFFLSIITLGIYSFWGRTEVRRRIWSSVRLDGEPLAYTGTGKELFLGFLFAMLIVFLPVFVALTVAAVVLGPNSAGYVVVTLIVYALFFLLMGVAIYRAQRYRLTRTEWRGIRGGLSGSATSYAWHWIWTGLLIGPTLGWIVPWRANRLQQHMTRDTTFGHKNFGYEGSASGLYGPFAVLWIGGIVVFIAVLGVITLINPSSMPLPGQQPRPPSPWQVVTTLLVILFAITLMSVVGAWYRSRTFNVFAWYTGFDQARFKLNTTPMGLIGLVISNFFITMLSLGILAPVAQARAAKYLVDRLSIEGTIDVDAILQSQAALGRGGEGMAQVLDVDGF